MFVLFLSKFIRKDSILKIGCCHLDFPALLQMAYNGSSEVVTQLCSGLSNLIFNWILIAKFGEVGVSAFAAVQYISLAINAIIMGMSRGIAAIISVNFGGKIIQRVRKILSLAVKTVTVAGILCTVFLLLFKNPLISVFVKGNSKVFEAAAEIISYYSFSFVFIGVNVVINTFYTAINDPKTSTGLAVLRFALLICAFFVLPFFNWKYYPVVVLRFCRACMLAGQCISLKEAEQKMAGQLIVAFKEIMNFSAGTL